MRIIAGTLRGRSLKSPPRRRTRPTAGRVRAAIFSALESMGADWRRALDLYAGSGALGIEALSRGAETVDSAERDERCCAVIRENLRSLGLSGRARVLRLEARRALRALSGEYGTIFLDPPYAEGGEALIEDLVRSGLVGEGSTIVLEHPRGRRPAEAYGDFHLARQLLHGDTFVSIFRRAGGEN